MLKKSKPILTAWEDCNKAIELDPNHTSAYNNREVAISKLKEQEGEP